MSKILKNSEIRYQCLIDNILDVIAELDLDGTFTYVSPQVYDIFGYYPEEIIGVKFLKFIHPNDMSILKEIMKKTIKSKDTISMEFKVRHKAGYYVSVSMRGNLVNIDGKNKFIGVLKDITERKKSEERILVSERKLKNLMEAIPIGISISTPEGEISEINVQIYKIFGYSSKEEFLKLPAITHYYDPKDRELFVELLERGFVKDFEVKFKRKDGTIFWGSATSISQKIGDQTIYTNAFQDITDRKKAEEEVADLAKFPEENPNLVLRVSKEFVLYANQSGQDLLSIKIDDRIPIILREIIKKAFEENVNQNLEVELNNHNYSLFVTPIKGTSYINVYGMDITERKSVEEERNKFFNLSLHILLIAGFDGTILRTNPGWKEVLGYGTEELVGQKFIELVHPDDRADTLTEMEKLSQGITTMHFENRYLKNDGSYRTLVWSAVPNLEKRVVYAIAHDITERKNVEEDLRYLFEFERVISQLSIDLINVSNEKLDELITYALQQVAQHVNAVRSSLFIFSEDLTRVTNTHEWCAIPEDSQIDLLQNISAEKFGYYFKLLKEKKNVIISNFDDIPREAVGEREWCKEYGFRSLLFVPMLNKNKLYCTVGFYGEINKEREWAKDLINLLEIFANIFVNATVRKQAEQELKESEEKYRLITESISDPLHVVDADLKIIYLNPAFIEWLKVLGLNHEIIGKTPAEAFPFIGEKATKEYQEVFNSKKEHFLEDSTVLNNKRIFTETRKIPVLNDGKVIQVITIVRDVTERKEAEFKLIESEQKYRNLVETSSMGLLELNIRKGGVVYINPRLLKIVGYTQKELLSKGMFYKAIYPEDYKKVTKSDEEKDIEFRIINKEGNIKWLSGRTLHHYDEQGKLIYLRLWLQDITERKELEEIKSNLLTRISHEIKTPLISIKGFTDLMLSEYAENLDDKMISFLERIKDGGNRLKSLINTFLESTQLDKEYVELNLNQENLSLLIRSSLEQMEGVINMREQTVDLNIHDDLTTIFDKERIESVFTNLLINAIYYTPKGGNISIQSNIKGKSIIISVKDNGIGLSKEEVSQLFKPFGKIERYGKRWDIISEGMGMGLHISKDIIYLHGGKIWAESDGIDKGSKFSFSLPIVKN